MQSSETIYLSAEQLSARSLVGEGKQGGGTSDIDEALDLDREGITCLLLSPFRVLK
jgi:hypothetical protein